MERKFHGSESSLYGLFAPGNESAEERKGQLPHKVLGVHAPPDIRQHVLVTMPSRLYQQNEATYVECSGGRTVSLHMQVEAQLRVTFICNCTQCLIST